MILISHRGNIHGPNTTLENKPEYIIEAISSGFDAEVDVWLMDNNLFLGHDSPQYKINKSFLNINGLWIHCKNYNALKELSHSNLNVFYHTTEDYVLTSKGFIWAYPGKPGNINTICVMPEWTNAPIEGYAGICSDYIGNFLDGKVNNF